jgi:hypothetical protein
MGLCTDHFGFPTAIETQQDLFQFPISTGTPFSTVLLTAGRGKKRKRKGKKKERK